MTDPLSVASITLDDLEQFLTAPATSPELIPFLNAAAVLVGYHPRTLRPTGGAAERPPAEMPEGVLARSEQITAGPLAGRWALKLGERRAALRRLGPSGIAAALAANSPRPDSPVQRLFERVAAGNPPGPDELAAMNRDTAAALLVVHRWLDGLAELPARAEIERAVALAELFDPMRRLTVGGVAGRDRELAQLARFLTDPGVAQPPVFVHGIGGIGKSTLLARFILDRAVPQAVPAAYLDLDRPVLRPGAPTTILLVALGQLTPQLGLDPGLVTALTNELTTAARRVEDGRELESVNTSQTPHLLSRFAGMVRQALGERRLLMVVDTFEEAQYQGDDVTGPLVDFLLALGRALPALRLVIAGRDLPDIFLRATFPQLVRIDARALADIEPATSRPIDLAELDLDAARLVLRTALKSTRRAPLTDREADDVIDVVTRNPMCLRLAARHLVGGGLDELRADRSTLLGDLRAEKVQAMLYGRILRQLHSAGALALAEPGLVLRRITPEIIREVLAGPCGLDLSVHDEHALFGQLLAERALVERDPDGALRHRADVRRAMLDDLTDRVPPELAERINRAAVEYYRRRDQAVDRAEELYHRLRLAEPAAVLDERWSDAARPWLVGPTARELAPTEQLWLATKLRQDVGAALRTGADLATWERQAALSAQRYLLAQRPDAALQVLAERAERSPRSPLYLVETDVLQSLARLPDALITACTGVRTARRDGDWQLAVRLLLKMSVIQEGRGQLTELAQRPDQARDAVPGLDTVACRLEDIGGARQLVEEAVRLSEVSGDRMLRFHAGVTELRVLRRIVETVQAQAAKAQAAKSQDAKAQDAKSEGGNAPAADPPVANPPVADELAQQIAALEDELAQRRVQLLAALDGGMLAVLPDQPVLLREAAAELGADSPRIASLAIETLGVEVADPDQASMLGQTVAGAVQAGGMGQDDDLADAARTFQEAKFEAGTVRDWVSSAGRERHSRQLGRSLAGSERGTEVLQASQNYFRAGVSSSLRINWVHSLRLAAQQFDWRAVTDVADGYVDALRAAPDDLVHPQAREILRVLREHRRYDDLLRVADALLMIDLEDPVIRRALAQALVDRERPAAARLIFQSILDAPDTSAGERAEACGGIGRCAKEMFLTARDPNARQEFLQQAYLAYRRAYDNDPGLYYYQGINVVAVLARAGRDGIRLREPDDTEIASPEAAARQVARQVLEELEKPAEPDVWALTSRCEANLALGEYEAAVAAVQHIVDAKRANAFELAALLRQLRQMWGVTSKTPPGDRIVPLLRAELMQSEGGDVLVGASDLREARFAEDSAESIERIFATTSFRSLTWYRTGLARCRAVAGIESATGRLVGTGVLFDGTDLHPDLPGRVLVTNAHVLPEALPPEEAAIVFHGLDADDGARRAFPVRRLLWRSPSVPTGLDISVLELDGYPETVTPVTIADGDPQAPLLGAPMPRAYVIGYSTAADLPFSVQDSTVLDFDEHLLHYRSPSPPGSSGSPLFDSEWRLLGLHLAGGHDVRRLKGHGGTYAASKAVRGTAIRAAIARTWSG